MTGGTLFLLDSDGESVQKLHTDVETIAIDGERAQWLRRLIEDFANTTSSPRALALLREWDQVAHAFIAVEPVGFRRTQPQTTPPQPINDAVSDTRTAS